MTDLADKMPSNTVGALVIAYDMDDSCPVSAYMLIQKELKN